MSGSQENVLINKALMKQIENLAENEKMLLTTSGAHFSIQKNSDGSFKMQYPPFKFDINKLESALREIFDGHKGNEKLQIEVHPISPKPQRKF